MGKLNNSVVLSNCGSSCCSELQACWAAVRFPDEFLAQLLQQLADTARPAPAIVMMMMSMLCDNLILEVLLIFA